MTAKPPKLIINPETNYRALLGRGAWQRLHPDIRKRFGPEYAHRRTCYQGVMDEVTMSFCGRLLAWACCLIGTPLSLYEGDNVPVTVTVYPDRRVGGMAWDRRYCFPGRAVNRVRSTKCIQSGLIEVVGFGFGMRLSVEEREGAIRFSSTRFFWQLGRFKLPIPHVLTPGKTTVVQTALEAGRFRFDLQVVHSLLGRMFNQTGVFREEAQRA